MSEIVSNFETYFANYMPSKFKAEERPEKYANQFWKNIIKSIKMHQKLGLCLWFLYQKISLRNWNIEDLRIFFHFDLNISSLKLFIYFVNFDLLIAFCLPFHSDWEYICDFDLVFLCESIYYVFVKSRCWAKGAL